MKNTDLQPNERVVWKVVKKTDDGKLKSCTVCRSESSKMYNGFDPALIYDIGVEVKPKIPNSKIFSFKTRQHARDFKSSFCEPDRENMIIFKSIGTDVVDADYRLDHIMPLDGENRWFNFWEKKAYSHLCSSYFIVESVPSGTKLCSSIKLINKA